MRTRLAIFASAVMPLALMAQQTVVLRDGTRFNGRMTSATQSSIMFRDDAGINHRFDVNNIDAIRFGGGSGPGAYNQPDRYNNAPYNSQSAPQYDARNGNNDYPAGRGYARREGNRMYLQSGTEISVRTNENINSSDTSDNRFYSAVVSRDVMDDHGQVVIPRGSDAQLIVRRLSNNTVALDLQSISVNGQRFNVDTAEVTEQGQAREGVGENRRTATYAGGGAVLGTLLGAIAGGGKGAAIGALAGGAAGVGAQVLTRGGQVKVPAETELSFRLDQPMNLHF